VSRHPSPRISRGVQGEQWPGSPRERGTSGSSWTDPDASPGYRPEDATCRQGVDNSVDKLKIPCVETVVRAARASRSTGDFHVAQRFARTWPTLSYIR
jgi:hypothetical protein